MTTPAKLNEFNAAENPARRLLERLGWTYLHREALAAERGNERAVLLRGRLRGALLRLNPWLSESQADSVIGSLERVNATGMARNQAVHEYLTYGMPFDDRSGSSRRTRTVRFFDFDDPQERPQRVRRHNAVPRSPRVVGVVARRGSTSRTTSAWSSRTWCSSSTASRLS